MALRELASFVLQKMSIRAFWDFFYLPNVCSSRGTVESRKRRMVVETLEARVVFNVTYHGGALLTNVETQAVYLGSDWSSNATLKSQTTEIDNYLSVLVNSPYMDMLTNAGYNVGRGSSSPGVIDNVSVSKTTNLSDASIQSQLKAMVNVGEVAAPDANRLYVVYVEPGVVVSLGNSTSKNTFLGYHGAFAGPGGKDIRYAVMPYPGSPNPTPSSQGIANVFDELTMVTSHELAEAVTDPDVNYKKLGWYDDRLGGEIGDLTSSTTRMNNYLVHNVVDKNDQVISPIVGTTTISAPRNVSLTALSSTSVRVDWSEVTGAAGYRVFQVNGTQNVLLTTVPTGSTSVTLTGFTAGTSVTLFVQAFNASSKADSASASVSLPLTPATLQSPQLAASPLSSTRVTLSWNLITGSQGYRIYIWNGTKAVLLGAVSSTSSSVVVTGLTPGETVKFFVEAFNAVAVADSPWVSVTTRRR